MARRKKPVCASCGSDEVKRDAYAEWDVEAQKWVAAATFDSSICAECEGEAQLTWVDVPEGDA